MRPFKDIKKFNTKMHKSIGSTIKLRCESNPKRTITGMITSFTPDAIGIGGCVRYLNDMSNVYEHFDEDSVKWLPFVAINTFTTRMKPLFAGIAAGVEGNALSLGECAKEVKERNFLS